MKAETRGKAAVSIQRLLLAVALLVPAAGPALAESADGSLRGIVRATKEASISSDLNQQIVALPVKEGKSFEKGDVLAAFDCKELEAKFASVTAQLRAETLTYENNLRLSKLNAVGDFDLKLQSAKVEQATAERKVLASRVDRCLILAPYAGRVVELSANEYEFPSQGRPLMRIVKPGGYRDRSDLARNLVEMAKARH